MSCLDSIVFYWKVNIKSKVHFEKSISPPHHIESDYNLGYEVEKNLLFVGHIGGIRSVSILK